MRKPRTRKKRSPRQVRSGRHGRKSVDPPSNTPSTDVTVEVLLAGTSNWPEGLLVEVGAGLMGNRSVQPSDTGDYDDRIGIHYRAIDVKWGGFRIRANPRRIGVREVARHAYPSCRKCHGMGWWSVSRLVEVGRDEDGVKRMQEFCYEQSCGCAEKRYKLANPLFLIDSKLGEWIGLDGLIIEEVGDGNDRAVC